MLRVACLLYDGFLLLDMAGPLSSFEAARQCGVPGYSFEVLASASGLVTSSCGVTVGAAAFSESQGFDILIVPGGASALLPDTYPALLPFLRSASNDGCRIASICSGAFVLAEAGLLDGKTAATHWREAPELARRYPKITVDAESIFVRDQNVWTSAGVSSGIDLALAMIQMDYGAAVAKRVAQILVVSVNRPGSQSQHSALLDMVGPDNKFNEILVWAKAHLAEPLDVEQLAAKAAMSIRQFTRTFTASIGISPAKAVERLRVDAARTAIEAGAASLDQVARHCGFGNPDRMRRAILRSTGLSPQGLRRRNV
jgi:transcriptional regulator GlxA family with amidase domain